jgi:hypothetical protein
VLLWNVAPYVSFRKLCPTSFDVINTDAAAGDARFQDSQDLLDSYGPTIWKQDDMKEGNAVLTAMGYGV